VGEFIKYISEYKHSKKEVYPCIIEGNKIKEGFQWKTHKELDMWQNSQDPKFLQDYDALLKGFHRAFQIVISFFFIFFKNNFLTNF
jgi:hypothetical protein